MLFMLNPKKFKQLSSKFLLKRTSQITIDGPDFEFEIFFFFTSLLIDIYISATRKEIKGEKKLKRYTQGKRGNNFYGLWGWGTGLWRWCTLQQQITQDQEWRSKWHIDKLSYRKERKGKKRNTEALFEWDEKWREWNENWTGNICTRLDAEVIWDTTQIPLSGIYRKCDLCTLITRYVLYLI